MSRYFDRIARPEQIIPALQRAMAVLTDPAECGPVTLALCQDTQAEAYDYPESFFAEKIWTPRRIRPDEAELARRRRAASATPRSPSSSRAAACSIPSAEKALADFAAAARHLRSARRRPASRACRTTITANLGAIGVTGTGAANALAEEADVVLAVGTRLQDFTTGSWALFKNPDRRIVGLNVQAFDAAKHNALPLVADARVGLEELSRALGGWKAPDAWTAKAREEKTRWFDNAARYTDPTNAELPSDAQVIGAVQRTSQPTDVVVCAAGGLPGELHKHWKASTALGYHMEYGYSCMGYEIAGGLGVKMARSRRAR